MKEGNCRKCTNLGLKLEAMEAFLVSYMLREGITEIRTSQKDLPKEDRTFVKFDFWPDIETGELVCRVQAMEDASCNSGVH